MISNIITKRVLNENTGELETKDFREIKSTSRLRGGFRLMYKTHDEAISNIIKSSKDYEIVIYIRDQFTYQRIEVSLPAREIAKKLSTSQSKVSTIIKRMLEETMLKRITRGIYRFNPYMYIPYKSDGVSLQREWKELEDGRNVSKTN